MLSFVKFQHTLFALPFAFLGVLLAAGGWPGATVILWVLLAMVGARTSAMGLNRIIDREIDRRNPRTADRELPSGRLPLAGAWAVTLAGTLAFTVAGLNLNALTATLLPVAMAFFVVYPYLKRFTWLCHIWLGVTVGAAGAGGYIAVAGAFTSEAWLLWLAAAAWIAGFDVVYAMLDVAFDQAHGVHSVPADLGHNAAHVFTVGMYILAISAWTALALMNEALGVTFLTAVIAVVAPLLAWQVRLLLQHGPGRALAAFNLNLWIGSLLLAAALVDTFWLR
jgi:4-hydroxybenzoate polyprenyltransferase